MKKICIILLCMYTGLQSQAQTKKARIYGQADFLTPGDTVSLQLYHYGHAENLKELQTVYKSPVIDNSYSFDIPIGKIPLYCDLILSSRSERNSFSLLIEQGDSICIIQQGRSRQYNGNGSAKFKIMAGLTQIETPFFKKLHYRDTGYILQDFEIYDSLAVRQLHYLDAVKTMISPDILFLLKAGVLGTNIDKVYYMKAHFRGDKATPFLSALSGYQEKDIILNECKKLYKNPDLLAQADYFTECLTDRYDYDLNYLNHQENDILKVYKYVKSNFQGVLQEKLITVLLATKKTSFKDFGATVEDALTLVKNPHFKKLLLKLKEQEAPGSSAFNFILTDSNGNKRTYSEFKNKVMLLDFWFTGCPNCAKMTPYLLEIEKSFHNQDVVFVSVNTDRQKELWLKSLRAGDYSGKDALNVYTSGLGAQHPVLEYYGIKSFPTLILIGRNGKVLQAPTDPRIDKGKSMTRLIKNALKERY